MTNKKIKKLKYIVYDNLGIERPGTYELTKKLNEIIEVLNSQGETIEFKPGEPVFYCVKCRGNKVGKNYKPTTLSSGRLATEAICEVCGTKIFKVKTNYSQGENR